MRSQNSEVYHSYKISLLDEAAGLVELVLSLLQLRALRLGFVLRQPDARQNSLLDCRLGKIVGACTVEPGIIFWSFLHVFAALTWLSSCPATERNAFLPRDAPLRTSG